MGGSSLLWPMHGDSFQTGYLFQAIAILKGKDFCELVKKKRVGKTLI